MLESFERQLYVILLSHIAHRTFTEELSNQEGVVGEVNFPIKKQTHIADNNSEKYCGENTLGAFNTALQLKKMHHLELAALNDRSKSTVSLPLPPSKLIVTSMTLACPCFSAGHSMMTNCLPWETIKLNFLYRFKSNKLH